MRRYKRVRHIRIEDRLRKLAKRHRLKRNIYLIAANHIRALQTRIMKQACALTLANAQKISAETKLGIMYQDRRYLELDRINELIAEAKNELVYTRQQIGAERKHMSMINGG